MTLDVYCSCFRHERPILRPLQRLASPRLSEHVISSPWPPLLRRPPSARTDTKLGSGRARGSEPWP